MPEQYYKAQGYQARRSIGYLLRHGGKLMTARIEVLFAREDISFVQWVILMNLRDGLHMTATELCQQLCHDSGALTRVIDQLEQRGLLCRERSKADRRVVALALTDEGRAVTESFLPRLVELYNTLLADFTDAEAHTLIDLLTRLTAKLAEPALPAEV